MSDPVVTTPYNSRAPRADLEYDLFVMTVSLSGWEFFRWYDGEAHPRSYVKRFGDGLPEVNRVLDHGRKVWVTQTVLAEWLTTGRPGNDRTDRDVKDALRDAVPASHGTLIFALTLDLVLTLNMLSKTRPTADVVLSYIDTLGRSDTCRGRHNLGSVINGGPWAWRQ